MLTWGEIADRFAVASGLNFCEGCDALIPRYLKQCASCTRLESLDELAAMERDPRPEDMQ